MNFSAGLHENLTDIKIIREQIILFVLAKMCIISMQNSNKNVYHFNAELFQLCSHRM